MDNKKVVPLPSNLVVERIDARESGEKPELYLQLLSPLVNVCSQKPLRNREGEQTGGKPEYLPKPNKDVQRTGLCVNMHRNL
jgi:hypothetical protein